MLSRHKRPLLSCSSSSLVSQFKAIAPNNCVVWLHDRLQYLSIPPGWARRGLPLALYASCFCLVVGLRKQLGLSTSLGQALFSTPLLCISCGFTWSPLRLVGWTNIDTGAIVDFQATGLAGINFSMASQLVNGCVFPFSSKFSRSLFVSASISNRKQNLHLFELKLLNAKQNHQHVIMHHQGSHTTHVH